MKTKTFLPFGILFSTAIILISCSKDDNALDYLNQPDSAPKLRHVADSIYTSFFTPGAIDLNDHIITWGNHKGKLSVTAPTGIQLDRELQNWLSWNQNLDLGTYPITLTAENSKGKAEDKFILVSRFGGYFVRTYNNHPGSTNDMSIRQSFYFDPNGDLRFDDFWDDGNSVAGNWRWASKTEIQGSYSKHGKLDRHSFKATLDYDKDTGFPLLNGFWFEGTELVSGKEKGQIMFNYDKDFEYTAVYDELYRTWGNYPQIYTYTNPLINPIDQDKFAGWFSASCVTSSDSTNYRLYLGADKKIFRGTGNENETWSWLSDSEIQGTFMVHQDFEDEEVKFITFRGMVSIDPNGFPIINGHWYLGKEVVEGQEAGEVIIVNDPWWEW